MQQDIGEIEDEDLIHFSPFRNGFRYKNKLDTR